MGKWRNRATEEFHRVFHVSVAGGPERQREEVVRGAFKDKRTFGDNARTGWPR
jgi:hypothetical protein